MMKHVQIWDCSKAKSHSNVHMNLAMNDNGVGLLGYRLRISANLLQNCNEKASSV